MQDADGIIDMLVSAAILGLITWEEARELGEESNEPVVREWAYWVYDDLEDDGG